MAKRQKNYVSNKDLLSEIKLSKSNGKLTSRALHMLILISEGLITKLKYRDDEDRKDCLAFAQMDLLSYWNRFDENKSSNAFAYYTQIAKKGMAKGWNKLHPFKYSNTISIDGASTESAIYSL